MILNFLDYYVRDYGFDLYYIVLVVLCCYL
jgi:hypothetical protein